MAMMVMLVRAGDGDNDGYDAVVGDDDDADVHHHHRRIIGVIRILSSLTSSSNHSDILAIFQPGLVCRLGGDVIFQV